MLKKVCLQAREARASHSFPPKRHKLGSFTAEGTLCTGIQKGDAVCRPEEGVPGGLEQEETEDGTWEGMTQIRTGTRKPTPHAQMPLSTSIR